MEFFFRTPGNDSYQLIVNAADAKVLLKAGKVLPSVEIQVRGAAKSARSGGYIQTIQIPWSAFGLSREPDAGSVWAFNVGREYHSWNQFTSWARLESSFGESARWGALRFPGRKQLKHLKNLGIGRLYPGWNRISGTVPGLKKGKIELLDPSGKRVAEKILNTAGCAYEFKVRILPSESAEPYRLRVQDSAGKILEEESIPVVSAVRPVDFHPQKLACVSGSIVSAIVELNVSVPDLAEHGLSFRLIGNDGREKSSFLVNPSGRHSFRLWLKSSGLSPGKYELIPELPGDVGSLFRERGKMEITVYPAIF